ncbi:hypothetical protein QEZ54_27690 [Catellatospora sp. KI3]|uniref:hypothetical protein n=1 Tax=Catellatospora sp. KI3 TaxID=3041620 RepID=UPI002482F3D4|nr:hypothetical protein [Catellatospora sp. KI3]MDI1464759.1 hypothetical protein [Catellatospora sp. KI3]
MRTDLLRRTVSLTLGVTMAAALGVVAATAAAVVDDAKPAFAISGLDTYIARSEVVSRAQTWIDRAISPYVQAERTYGPGEDRLYRNDCSGLVDMAWHISTAENTGSLENITKSIGAAELRPGDALNNKAEGHVILFKRWIDYSSGKFEYFAFGSAPAHISVDWIDGGSDGLIDNHSAGNYKPRRYKKIVEDTGTIAVGYDYTQMIIDTQGRALAKQSVGLYGWTVESDAAITQVASNGFVQMILDDTGTVWAKEDIGLYGWTRETDPGMTAIAVGNDGTQMILDAAGRVHAKKGIGLYGWTKESDGGVQAIATNGGVQMIIGADGYVWAKNTIGLYGWTKESSTATAIAVGDQGLQMMLDATGQVWAKFGIGLYGWTQESGPGQVAIATGTNGLQMRLDDTGVVWAKNTELGTGGWVRESDSGVKGIATGGGVQMIIGAEGYVWAKQSIGLYGWTRESDRMA